MVIAVGASAAEISAVGGALAITINLYSPVAQNINGVAYERGQLLDQAGAQSAAASPVRQSIAPSLRSSA